MSMTLTGILQAIGGKVAGQNLNKVLERLGWDKLAVRLLGRPPKGACLLSHMIVAAGHGNRAPEFRGRFAKSGRDGIFYLQYRTSEGGLGTSSMWTLDRRIEITRQERYAPGLQAEFPIVSRFDHPEQGTCWFFGVRPDLVRDYPRESLNEDSYFQGRIIFQADDGTEQRCYFIVHTGNKSDMPAVIGEHMFSHVWEWEGVPVPNSDPESLFKH